MRNDHNASDLLILATPDAWSEKRVWGTGGWLPPQEREALDWLLLARILGLKTNVLPLTDPNCPAAIAGTGRAVVVAGPRDDLPAIVEAGIVELLRRKPAIAVFRTRNAEDQVVSAAGRNIRSATKLGELAWQGPGEARVWKTSAAWSPAAIPEETLGQVWASFDGKPVVWAHREGRGWAVELGFHPSRARDTEARVTQLLRHLLIWGPDRGVSWIDLSGTLILRMDDPGGSQNIHNRHWQHKELNAAAWGEIGRILLRHDAKLSVGYVGGWVDDGDRERGALLVAGEPSERLPGHVHPTTDIRYFRHCRPGQDVEHDYEGECRELRQLQEQGLVSIELHGFTHMHPNTAVWARADDRYDRLSWFRELGLGAQIDCGDRTPHPIDRGMEALVSYFGRVPCTLIPPGDEWTNDVLLVALDRGISLVSSHYLAIRHDDRLCWSTHICAPYLDRPDSTWFEAGLPVVGYFHDRDIALSGTGWFDRCLDEWRLAGAKNIIDFRCLHTLLSAEPGSKGVGEPFAPAAPEGLARFTRQRGDRA